MLRRSGHKRAGFTLIEMLVVVSIIVVLISLLLPAVMKVSEAADRAENRARLLAINTAMNTMKGNSAFGKPTYIPAGSYDVATKASGPFRLRNSYSAPGGAQPDVYSFEARYLIAMFNIQPDATGAITDLGYPNLSADLDANQTLTFFLGGIPYTDANGTILTGFSTNSQKPFAPRLDSSNNLDPTIPRKTSGIDLGGGTNKKPKYTLAPINGVQFARLVDPYGTPYAYFVAYNGQANKYFGHNTDAGFGGVQAYRSGPNATDPYENASGYQLISAGKNREFGATGNMRDIRRVGEDDFTNIIEKTLGSQ